MKTCIKCGKEINGGYYNTPIGAFCVDCYTDEDAVRAIKVGTEQLRVKNEILAKGLGITLPKEEIRNHRK